MLSARISRAFAGTAFVLFAVAAALIFADMIAFNSPRASAIGGLLKERVAPQWGPTAFECSDRIVIKPARVP